MTVHLLAVDRLQHALERRLDVIHQLVDDAIGANVHTLLGGEPLRRSIHLDVERDDDRLRRRGQMHVRLADVADGVMDQAHLQVLAGMLLADASERSA